MWSCKNKILFSLCYYWSSPNFLLTHNKIQILTTVLKTLWGLTSNCSPTSMSSSHLSLAPASETSLRPIHLWAALLPAVLSHSYAFNSQVITHRITHAEGASYCPLYNSTHLLSKRQSCWCCWVFLRGTVVISHHLSS